MKKEYSSELEYFLQMLKTKSYENRVFHTKRFSDS
jgi:hypothetical protein